MCGGVGVVTASKSMVGPLKGESLQRLGRRGGAGIHFGGGGGALLFGVTAGNVDCACPPATAL